MKTYVEHYVDKAYHHISDEDRAVILSDYIKQIATVREALLALTTKLADFDGIEVNDCAPINNALGYDHTGFDEKLTAFLTRAKQSGMSMNDYIEANKEERDALRDENYKFNAYDFAILLPEVTRCTFDGAPGVSDALKAMFGFPLQAINILDMLRQMETQQ